MWTVTVFDRECVENEGCKGVFQTEAGAIAEAREQKMMLLESIGEDVLAYRLMIDSGHGETFDAEWQRIYESYDWFGSVIVEKWEVQP